MKKPDLSIIIVNYDTKALLKQCLESVLSIKYQVLSIEIIIVDNNSTDGSVEYLLGSGFQVTGISKSKTRNQKPETRNLILIRNDRNLGFAAANNQGIKIARGECILLLNSDTIVRKGALEKLVAFAQRTPDAGVVVARLLNPDGAIQPSCYHSPSISGAMKEFWLGEKGAFSKYAPRGKKPVAVDAAVGAAFLISKKTIEKIGFLDERYFMYFEDLDYCRRAWWAGLKVYYLPEAEIIHSHGASGKKLDQQPNKWLIQSSKIYYGILKHYLINLIIWSGQKWQKVRKN